MINIGKHKYICVKVGKHARVNGGKHWYTRVNIGNMTRHMQQCVNTSDARVLLYLVPVLLLVPG